MWRRQRDLKGSYDVVLDGTEVKRVRVAKPGGSLHGGFGFQVDTGTLEIEDIRSRVVSVLAKEGK